MKAIPKVDLNGVFIEDEIGSVDVHGVIKIYEDGFKEMERFETQENLNFEEIPSTPVGENPTPVGDSPTPVVEKKVVAYLVAVPMKDSFYKPKFEIQNYYSMREHYVFSRQEALTNFSKQLENYEKNYQSDLEEWKNADSETKSENPPPYQPPEFVDMEEPDYSILWGEQLTKEEIEAIRNPPKDPNAPIPMSDQVNSIKEELSGTQMALVSAYEQMLTSQEEQSATQMALAEVYEQLMILQELINNK